MISRRRVARGFTLIEMLVVLAILGILSLVAFRAAGGLQDRARFDATQRALKDAEDAILGSTAPTSPVSFASGFLGDVGRLPNAAAFPGQPLRELWALPAGVAPSALVSDAVDPEVTLAVGWRGPYLRLPPGGANALDGYGTPLEIVATATPAVWAIRSLGSDGLVGGADYEKDLLVPLIDAAAGVQKTVAAVAGTVSVATPPSGTPSWSVMVFAYGPDPANGALHATPEDADTETSNLASPPVIFHYKFTGANALTPGPRALRAYVFATGTDPRAAALARSAVTPLLAKQGAQTIDLQIVP